MSNLAEFKDQFGKDLYGIRPSIAKQEGICVECKELALPKCYSDAGRREYQISGLCEVCFDKMFEEVDE